MVGVPTVRISAKSHAFWRIYGPSLGLRDGVPTVRVMAVTMRATGDRLRGSNVAIGLISTYTRIRNAFSFRLSTLPVSGPRKLGQQGPLFALVREGGWGRSATGRPKAGIRVFPGGGGQGPQTGGNPGDLRPPLEPMVEGVQVEMGGKDLAGIRTDRQTAAGGVASSDRDRPGDGAPPRRRDHVRRQDRSRGSIETARPESGGSESSAKCRYREGKSWCHAGLVRL